MRCANCGAEVDGNTIFCPHCGHRVKGKAAATSATSASRPQPEPAYRPMIETFEPEVVESRRSSSCQWVLLTALFTFVFLLIVLGLGALGIYPSDEEFRAEVVL